MANLTGPVFAGCVVGHLAKKSVSIRDLAKVVYDKEFPKASEIGRVFLCVEVLVNTGVARPTLKNGSLRFEWNGSETKK